MHITHVISGLDPRAGGPPAALFGLARALKAVGVDLTVVSTWQQDDNLVLVDGLRQEGVDVKIVGPVQGRLGRHRDLSTMLDSAVANTSIVHIHAVWEEIQHQAARLAQRNGTPYIIRPCGMLDPWCLDQKRLKKKLYMIWRLRKDLDRATAIHFTSNAERDLTHPLHIKAPSIVEPNGVDLTEFEDLPQPGAFRAKHPQIADRPLLLFLSRLHHKKGLDLLIPAFAKLTGDAILVLAGPDSDGYRAQIESWVQDRGLTDRVVFTGMLYGSDRVAAMVDADLFVLPSYQENFGIVVVEALAAGTPVVISNQVNIHDRITQAGVGVAVPTEIDALAGQLKRWLTDDDLRRQAASQARAFVWANYDWRQIAEKWKARYREMLNGT